MGNRVLKIHLYRDEDTSLALCGKTTESGSTDHEETSCNTCSGIYSTNMEWYSKIRNRHMEPKNDTGSGDIYTRSDLEAGLMRMGWGSTFINEILDNTKLFRNVALDREIRLADNPWEGLTTVTKR